MKMEKGVGEITVQKRKIGDVGDQHRASKFGYFGCNPSFLQWLNSPWAFLVLIILAVLGNSKSSSFDLTRLLNLPHPLMCQDFSSVF